MKTPHPERLLRFMHARGGEINRRAIIVLFNRNLNRARIDALLADPHLAGMIVSSTEPMRGKRRNSNRYRLTASGWAAANALVHQAPALLNREEVMRQFELLVASGDRWAVELSGYASSGRATDALRQRREAEARETRQREIDALPRHPSAKRKRSQRDIERRAAWCAKHGFGLLVQNAEAEPVSVAPDPLQRIAPAVPVAPAPISATKPLTSDQQAAKDFREALGLSGRFYGPSASSVPRDCAPPIPADPKELAKSQALSQKIKAEGYTVRADGKVLYAGSWISPEAWQARMPGVID